MTPLLFFITVMIWGTTFYAITLQLGEVPALQSVFYRFALAAILMWLFVLIRKPRIHYGRDIHLLFALLGLLIFSLNYVIVYFATAYLISGLVSVIFSLLIVFNTVFYWIIFREKPTPALLAGSLLGVSGLAILFINDILALSLTESVFLGIALALLSTLLASSGNIIAQMLKLKGIDVISCNTWGMSYGSLFLLIAIMLVGEPWQFSMQADYVLSLLYLSVAGTVIAFWTYLTLIHRVGAPRAAYTMILFPLVALIVSTIYEDMQWTVFELLGVGLIIAGNLFIVQRKQAIVITETALPKI
jgi:drug/metabolite transporter (DMT)-like permease